MNEERQKVRSTSEFPFIEGKGMFVLRETHHEEHFAVVELKKRFHIRLA